MDLQKHYQQLYLNAVEAIKKDEYSIDDAIGDPADQRLGLTLIIRPSHKVVARIKQILAALSIAAPGQYIYPDTAIHITALSIINCYTGFRSEAISLPDYIALIEESLQEINAFDMQFKGITAANTGVMLQGYPGSPSLEDWRNKLRSIFRHADLEQSIDKRYIIQTAHATVMRFRKPLENKAALLACLQHFEDYDFGTFKVKEAVLVVNDWYHTAAKTKELAKFSF